MRRVLALEDDVKDRVQAAGAGQHAPEVALGHEDRIRALTLAVEDAGDEPFLPQAPGICGPARLAFLDRQLDSFASHFRRRMVATSLHGG